MPEIFDKNSNNFSFLGRMGIYIKFLYSHIKFNSVSNCDAVFVTATHFHPNHIFVHIICHLELALKSFILE
jgi:hypothetical protein